MTTLTFPMFIRNHEVDVMAELVKTEWGFELEWVEVVGYPTWNLDNNERWEIKEEAIKIYREGI